MDKSLAWVRFDGTKHEELTNALVPSRTTAPRSDRFALLEPSEHGAHEESRHEAEKRGRHHHHHVVSLPVHAHGVGLERVGGGDIILRLVRRGPAREKAPEWILAIFSPIKKKIT